MKQILTSAILLTLVAILFVPATVEASSISWSVGSAFRIGGASFHIAVRDSYYGGAPYYYRTRGPIHRSGYACGSACFLAEGYYYHDPYCPLATAYFTGYGHAPYNLFMSYGPRSGAYFRYDGPRVPYYRSGAPYRAYPPHAHHSGPGYYAPYGYNLDRRGSRYEYYDRRRHDRGNHRGHDRGQSRGHDRGNPHRH